MKAATPYLIALLVLILGFFFIDITGAKGVPLSYEVTDIRRDTTFITRRPINKMEVCVTHEWESLTGLVTWKSSRAAFVEITEEATRELKVGQMLTVEEVEAARGRSNLNRAWDWLKKTR